MKRSAAPALLALLAGLLFSSFPGGSAAQTAPPAAAGARKVTVTLVRWPYT